MGRRKKDEMGSGWFWLIFIVGGSVCLIMTHPLIFFLVVVPIAIILILAFIGWLKK